MKKATTTRLNACGFLAPDIQQIAAQLNIALTMNFLPGGLHDRPDKLRAKLQEAMQLNLESNQYLVLKNYSLGIYRKMM